MRPPEGEEVMAGNQAHEHLLRRAGFGAGAAELAALEGKSAFAALAYVLDVEDQPDDVDSKIGQSDHISVTAVGRPFSPDTSIEDARQRWLFRMVHSQRPLQEKMALFWHNHFATAYSKVAGAVGALQGTKMMALKGGELPGPPGQIELFREQGLGSFRDLLVAVARDPAMLVWLDGRTNTRQRPQENFGREIMELFTFGRGPGGEALQCRWIENQWPPVYTGFWVSTYELFGVQDIGSPCPKPQTAAQAPDGRPLLCLGGQGWQPGFFTRDGFFPR